MTFTPDIPEPELKRLKQREQAQRAETKRRGLPSKPVSVEGLLLLQRGLCAKSEKPLIFDEDHPDRASGKPVIAHVIDRTVKRCPGHVVGNVELWRHDANQAETKPENEARGLGRRHAVNKLLACDRPENPKSRWNGRGFPEKPEGYKYNWGKR